ncbi:hypothetical protein LTR56_015954 [Elasticomyces elasticus]|nr:hypothetical protein LTR56_015954 [Elasticomyces elasticus]KAK3655289.1 hypothetical protein LTR22_010319 [Elasticomyces elasticus]KAK4918645.1 hypothetical protein LTR49_013570 [Elasticomyces elasticus]KAK5751937.1 hypothetical protein LTS12_017953 [Elasticomyces elasticus]
MEQTKFEHPDVRHIEMPSPSPSGSEKLELSDAESLTWDIEEETRIRRKLDWHIVPLVTLLYLLCFIDRANIGNARIQGMAKDLELVGYRFNWALTVFYFTYVAVEIPSNTVLKLIGPRFYIPFLVAAFGLVSMCTAFVQDFKGLCVARAALGLAEGGTMPGIAFFLSCFYKRRELLFRVGIFVSAASMAGAFGGLLATGLARIPPWGAESMKIHTWRNIFLFEGLFTIIVACLAPIWMQTKPEECKFLSPRERMIAAERLRREHKADSHEVVKAHHFKRAVFNVNNIVCAMGFFCVNITVQSFSLFLPSILADLGWTATKAQLYSVPPYCVAVIVAITVAFVSDRTNLRGIYLATFPLLCVVGFSILRASDNPNLKYMAVFFSAAGAFPGGPGFLSWGLNNASGPAVRAVSGAYIVSIGSLGAIVATWTYILPDAPNYPIGHTINLCAQICVSLLATFGIVYCVMENRARARGKRDARLDGLSPEEVQHLGYRNPEFRYIP